MLWGTGKGTHSNQYIGQVKVRSRQGLEQYMFKESSIHSCGVIIKGEVGGLSQQIEDIFAETSCFMVRTFTPHVTCVNVTTRILNNLISFE